MWIRLLVAVTLAAYGISAQEPDFRNVTWGMTQAQVMAAEPVRPIDVSKGDGETIVKYEPVDGAQLTGRLIYIFANDKLVRAKYVSNAKHSDLNNFIADFRAVEPVLLEKYGRPTAERAVWENDALQLERLPYLDQDRALPSEILPSDPNVGLSVAKGYLKLYTQRISARTKILHALTGENDRILHQVEYRSVDLETLEKEVLHSGGR